jgi:hypothetical protein
MRLVLTLLLICKLYDNLCNFNLFVSFFLLIFEVLLKECEAINVVSLIYVDVS